MALLAAISLLLIPVHFLIRINPDVKMNYLASPPLVIAYALAGTMDFDFDTQPLGRDAQGRDVLVYILSHRKSKKTDCDFLLFKKYTMKTLLFLFVSIDRKSTV